MSDYVIRLRNDEESLRRASERLKGTLLEFIDAADALAKATSETYVELANAYCRLAGKALVLSIYERIDWSYFKNRRRGKKNTRLQRVARQGSASAAARLSILSDLRQKRAFGRGCSSRSHYTIGGRRCSLQSQEPAKPLQAVPYHQKR